jgi:hypothetical protein
VVILQADVDGRPGEILGAAILRPAQPSAGRPPRNALDAVAVLDGRRQRFRYRGAGALARSSRRGAGARGGGCRARSRR